MLKDARVGAALPCADIDRAKAFYADKFGLDPDDKSSDGGYVYRCADGTIFSLFPSSGAASGTHTQLAFMVSDFDAEIADLRSRGVTFEEYDLPGFKTVDGVADLGGERGVWVKDSEGNLITIGEFSN